MPVALAKTKLHSSIVECMHAYWRVRAANAALLHFSSSSPWSGLPLNFDNLPNLGAVPAPPTQTMQMALAEIQQYVRDGRAVTEHFMTAISHFESFLADLLRFKSVSPDGTLGQLIIKVQQAFSLPTTPEVEALVEIRERRNVLIHHHGVINQKYLQACAPASLPNHLRLASIGQVLVIDNEYFAYACDRMLAYSQLYN